LLARIAQLEEDKKTLQAYNEARRSHEHKGSLWNSITQEVEGQEVDNLREQLRGHSEVTAQLRSQLTEKTTQLLAAQEEGRSMHSTLGVIQGRLDEKALELERCRKDVAAEKEEFNREMQHLRDELAAAQGGSHTVGNPKELISRLQEQIVRLQQELAHLRGQDGSRRDDIAEYEVEDLKRKLAEATREVERLQSEKSKLMVISNMRKAELSKAMSERESAHLSALEAAEKAGRETSKRYEGKIAQIEETIKSLVETNRTLTEELRAVTQHSEDDLDNIVYASNHTQQGRSGRAGGNHRNSELQKLLEDRTHRDDVSRPSAETNLQSASNNARAKIHEAQSRVSAAARGERISPRRAQNVDTDSIAISDLTVMGAAKTPTARGALSPRTAGGKATPSQARARLADAQRGIKKADEGLALQRRRKDLVSRTADLFQK